jgi:SAM-dependent methyltransferase
LKLCLHCRTRYGGDDWRCERCGTAPLRADGFPTFAPGLADDSDGFEPGLFAELAQLEAGNFWFRSRNRLLLWALGRYFGEARSLLEIGCGTGFVLSGIARTLPHLRLCGSEIHAAALPFAASRLPGVELMQMDARAVPFVDEFDVVGAFDVIEHVEDDAGVLRQMFQAAAPGGGVLLTVPQHPGLWSEFDRRSRHVRRYRAGELRTKLRAAGFTVLRVTSFVSLLLPLLLASRRRPRGAEQFDPLADLRVGAWSNALLERILDAERVLIRAGLSLPAGGSLLAVGRKPA